MIDKAGAAARPDRVEVEFGLKFSASGGVIMAGVAGEASLKVTLGYDVAARPVTGAAAGAAAGTAPGGHAAGAAGWVVVTAAARASGCAGAGVSGAGPRWWRRPGGDVFPGRAGRAGDRVACPG